MKKIITYIFFVFLIGSLSAQENKDNVFRIYGSVKGKENRTPIPDVEVYVVGGQRTRTDFLGKFNLTASIGDEIVFRSPEFETVYYRIISSEEIDVLVEGYRSPSSQRLEKAAQIKKEHGQYLDSANTVKKQDIGKSLDFVERSLSVLGNAKEAQKRSLSFFTLGEIYFYWKQYDLAINSYLSSIDARSSLEARIQLGKAYYLNKQYTESNTIFEALKNERKLSSYQKITVHEGLGDALKELDKPEDALKNYQEALDLAQKNLVTPKITDLNSKIADVYARTNETGRAQNYFSNSLNLAQKENTVRSIQEKDKVADFYNDKSEYDKEIELRKSALEEVKKLKRNDNIGNVSKFSIRLDEDQKNDDNGNPDTEEKINAPVGLIRGDTITTQKLNYKIANAFIAQDKYEEAIPYLQESIAEADEVEDLIVKKDATRKLSEAYRTVGDYSKAQESYEDYVEQVEQLYIKKEQEISQLTRFSRDIANKQNRITSLEKDRQLSESKYNLALKDQELIKENNKRQRLIIYSLIFGILMIALVAFLFYRTTKQQKLANNLLALKSLRSQMNPHFIFNALNSVNNFIAKSDERSANRYLSEFSTLMRSVLENSEEDFIPLSRELELIELYTKLEHSRFAEKFEYEIKIDENVEIGQFEIPPMLLQPYIENAIWHGLRYKEDKGWLKIHFSQPDADHLRVEVEDNGVGRKQSVALKTENQKKQKSKGMSNIQKRIAILNDMYKDRIDVHVEDLNGDGTGTRVMLTLKKD
ncbi:sensor histidine kinase [Leptobacterium flavescens]|uniref:Sensor histidine kinase n=1 Tax=Leptobacterium flavescens TaxID=472055 RepID=A0A6P0UNR7_9FLAO|nr:histidine kinase [Leptobacterium flavescens]NER12633.1 sensor histidine kinase [Leptobacterium flavescens]